MKLRAPILLVGGLLLSVWLLGGCWTLSLHPLFTDSTLTFDERLIGIWKSEGATAVFTQAGEKRYRIQYMEKNESSLLDARLVQLGDQRYLDVSPLPAEEDVVSVHRIDGHSIWKVSWEGEALHLIPIDFDWLRDLLEKKPNAISTVRMNKDIILLTATTEELQQFVQRNTQEAFKGKDLEPWRRVPAPKQ